MMLAKHRYSITYNITLDFHAHALSERLMTSREGLFFMFCKFSREFLNAGTKLVCIWQQAFHFEPCSACMVEKRDFHRTFTALCLSKLRTEFCEMCGLLLVNQSSLKPGTATIQSAENGYWLQDNYLFWIHGGLSSSDIAYRAF